MPSERQEAPPALTWLSTTNRSTPVPAEPAVRGPSAKMTGRKAFHQAKQSNLFSFFGKELAASTTAAEPAGKGKGRASSAHVGGSKGKGRELSASSSDDPDGGEDWSRPPARKKARASEPLPQTTAHASRRSVEPVALGSASGSRRTSKRPRLSAPVAGVHLAADSPAPLARTDPAHRKGRATRTASPPPPVAIKRERLEMLRGLEDDDGYSSPGEYAIDRAQAGALVKAERSPPPSDDERRRRKARPVKKEPALLAPASIGDACPASQESDTHEEDSNDQVADIPVGQPSYHRPTSLLSESLAPYLPASYPSPQRLPQHIVDDLLNIGRPFGGPNGHERFLRRPRMPWETDEAWSARQAELRQWEVDERLRKERAARPLEPPARQLQPDEREGRRLSIDVEPAFEGEASEPDTYFAGGPKKLHWPKPPVGPANAPTIIDGPFGPRPPPLSAPVNAARPTIRASRTIPSPIRSSPSRASSTSPTKEHSLFPGGEESYTLPATHPYPRPFIPTAPGALGPATSALSVHRSEASGEGSYTAPDSYRISRRSQPVPQGASSPVRLVPSDVGQPQSPMRDLRTQPPKSAPRRLTEEEETSVILEINRSRPSVSPERLASPPPKLVSAGHEAGGQDDLGVVPSSQTEEAASSLFAPFGPAMCQAPATARTPGPSPARILVLASQETAQPSPSKRSTPRPLGLAASQPSLRTGGAAAASPRRLAFSPSQPSPSRLDSVVLASPDQQIDGAQAESSPSRSLLLMTPTHGRTSDSEEDIVPTSVAAERPENDIMLVWQRAQAKAAAGKSASPTPTKKGAKVAGRLPSASVAMPTVASVTDRSRSKPRTSWPVWTGAGLVDADAPVPAGDGDDELSVARESQGKASVLAGSKPLAQDSLLQHGFGRSVVRAPRQPSPETAVPVDEAITDEEDEGDAPMYDDSIVPSSQSLAPLGWGVRRYGEVSVGGKRIGPVPSPPPRTVIARPSRYKPPKSPVKVAFAHDLTRIAATKPRSPTPSPRKAGAVDPDVTFVDLSQPLRSSTHSTSEDEEDEVDADVTLLAPPPFDLSMLSQGTVPDSQPPPERRSSPELMPPPQSSRAPLHALLQAESTNYEWLRSSSGSSADNGLDPGLGTF